jgi:hypothetical protein
MITENYAEGFVTRWYTLAEIIVGDADVNFCA